MGRIIAPVKIENVVDTSKNIRCDAMVDTGAALMTLPRAWKDRLGDLQTIQVVDVELASQEQVQREICGPVRIQIEGFRPVHCDVLFVEMKPKDGTYQPLIGYIVLELCPAAVDEVGHRLIPLRYFDLK